MPRLNDYEFASWLLMASTDRRNARSFIDGLCTLDDTTAAYRTAVTRLGFEVFEALAELNGKHPSCGAPWKRRAVAGGGADG